MQVRVLIFGKLVDIVKSTTLTLSDIADTNTLVNELNKQYPALPHSKYVMAVDKKTIIANTVLEEESTVALLPPFSGG